MLRFQVLNTAVWIIVKSMLDSILAMVGSALVEDSDMLRFQILLNTSKMQENMMEEEGNWCIILPISNSP